MVRTLVNPIETEKKFRDEPVTPVYRHWLCETDECDGEMVKTGHGVTTGDTSWLHRCNKCQREEWADRNYPQISYL